MEQNDVNDLRLKQLEEQINKINTQLEALPDRISASVENTINLKIENATQKLKIDFYKWLVPIILGLLFSAGGTIFNFIK